MACLLWHPKLEALMNTDETRTEAPSGTAVITLCRSWAHLGLWGDSSTGSCERRRLGLSLPSSLLFLRNRIFSSGQQTKASVVKEVGNGEACGFSLQGMSPAKQAEVLWKSLFWLRKDSQEWEWSRSSISSHRARSRSCCSEIGLG